ncbi:Ferrienterobactin-binding periplasmic protein precursor [Rothia kristinae]|nr:Ferrienterobactin-binding periplasmic protein precursor [Rothia kristinae]
MTPTKTPLRRLLAALIFALCGVFALSACGSGDGSSEDSSDSASASASSGDWPRTIKDDNGDEVTIDSQPKSIVSTSVTLTGPCWPRTPRSRPPASPRPTPPSRMTRASSPSGATSPSSTASRR